MQLPGSSALCNGTVELCGHRTVGTVFPEGFDLVGDGEAPGNRIHHWIRGNRINSTGNQAVSGTIEQQIVEVCVDLCTQQAYGDQTGGVELVEEIGFIGRRNFGEAIGIERGVEAGTEVLIGMMWREGCTSEPTGFCGVQGDCGPEGTGNGVHSVIPTDLAEPLRIDDCSVLIDFTCNGDRVEPFPDGTFAGVGLVGNVSPQKHRVGNGVVWLDIKIHEIGCVDPHRKRDTDQIRLIGLPQHSIDIASAVVKRLDCVTRTSCQILRPRSGITRGVQRKEQLTIV